VEIERTGGDGGSVFEMAVGQALFECVFQNDDLTHSDAAGSLPPP
jgi:hypothetical protein